MISAAQKTLRLRAGVGSVFGGKYVIERVIASGGMGLVARARNVDLDIHVAIKVMHPWLLQSPELHARFFREAREVAKLSSEHIVRVLDVSSPRDPWPYMVMELLDGSDLESVLAERGRLSVRVAVDFAIQACRGLRVSHAAGIVHRDIKPANLFFARGTDGPSLLKIVDFGILHSRSANVKLTRRHQLLGSPMYMAPEQLVGAEVDARADVFSLGVSLYEMLTGISPFEGSTLSRVVHNVTTLVPRAPCEILPSIPSELSSVVMRCLEKDRARRFCSVEELAAALEPFGPTRDDTPITAIPIVRRIPGQGSPSLTLQRAVAFFVGFVLSAAALIAVVELHR